MDKKEIEQKYVINEMEVVQNVISEKSDKEQILNKAYKDMYEGLEMINENHLELSGLKSEVDTDLIEECAETIIYLEGLEGEFNDTDIKTAKENGIKYYNQKIKEINRKKQQSFIVVAASIFLILMISTTTVIQAFEINFFRVVVEWSMERFSLFVNERGDEEKGIYNGEYLEFDSLKEALRKTGAEFLYPKWIPDNYEFKKITVEGADILAIYSLCYDNGVNEIFVTIADYNNPNDTSVVVEKTDDEPVTYIYNGITHYIMNNTNGISAVWKMDNQIYNICGRIVQDDIKLIINSMY